MLKNLRLLQWRPKLRVGIASLATDGRSKLSSTEGKLEKWCEHFDEDCNISTAVVENLLETVPEVRA